MLKTINKDCVHVENIYDDSDSMSKFQNESPHAEFFSEWLWHVKKILERLTHNETILEGLIILKNSRITSYMLEKIKNNTAHVE